MLPKDIKETNNIMLRMYFKFKVDLKQLFYADKRKMFLFLLLFSSYYSIMR